MSIFKSRTPGVATGVVTFAQTTMGSELFTVILSVSYQLSEFINTLSSDLDASYYDKIYYMF